MADFRPKVDQVLDVHGVRYTFAANPRTPRFAMRAEGRYGTVFKLHRRSLGNGDFWALKVFHRTDRADVRAQLEAASLLASLDRAPGLRAAKREVITSERHPALVGQHPALDGAILMPYILGETWAGHLKRVFERCAGAIGHTRAERFALGALETLGELEGRGVAHTDVSAANVMLVSEDTTVEFIDLEDLYAEGRARPHITHGATEGYRHPSLKTDEDVWRPEADRFSGLVLVTEMLSAGYENFATWLRTDDHLWTQDDLGDTVGAAAVYRVLDALRARYPRFTRAFEASWKAPSLAHCASLRELMAALGEDLGASPLPEVTTPGDTLLEWTKPTLGGDVLGADTLVDTTPPEISPERTNTRASGEVWNPPQVETLPLGTTVFEFPLGPSPSRWPSRSPPATDDLGSIEFAGVLITRAGVQARDGRFRIDEDILECRYERVKPSRGFVWGAFVSGAALAVAGMFSLRVGVILAGVVLVGVGAVAWRTRPARFCVWVRTERGARVELTNTADEEVARGLCSNIERYHASRSGGTNR